MPEDPEKLVADALRAQATSSGAHLPTPHSHPSTGLPRRPAPPRTITTPWVLLLAVLLGLAAGTLVAVITLT